MAGRPGAQFQTHSFAHTVSFCACLTVVAVGLDHAHGQEARPLKSRWLRSVGTGE